MGGTSYYLTLEEPGEGLKRHQWDTLAGVFEGGHIRRIVYWVEHTPESDDSDDEGIAMMTREEDDEERATEEATRPHLTTVMKLARGRFEFELLPTMMPKQRQLVFAAGASGSGKSSWGARYGKLYRQVTGAHEVSEAPDPLAMKLAAIRRASGGGRQGPDPIRQPRRRWVGGNPVYVISEKQHDEALRDVAGPPEQVPLADVVELYAANNSNADETSMLEPFRESLVFIDDVDALTGVQKKAVIALQDKIARMGRAPQIDAVFIRHVLTEGMASRVILQEATHIVLFPSSTTAHQLEYLLTEHIGFSKSFVASLRLPGMAKFEWVIVSKNAPRFIMTPTTLRLILETPTPLEAPRRSTAPPKKRARPVS